jgi:hypothetical protein
MSKRGKTRRVPIERREGEVLGENDGEFLTEFQNFQNFSIPIPLRLGFSLSKNLNIKKSVPSVKSVVKRQLSGLGDAVPFTMSRGCRKWY